jgi:hypothetical protein
MKKTTTTCDECGKDVPACVVPVTIGYTHGVIEIAARAVQER